jgi:hypothetical protein
MNALVRKSAVPVAALLFFLIPAAASAQVYPVKKSANGRYLVDQNNVPFLIAGDAPQSLMVNLSTTDADSYFANRKSHGFNAVWINLLCNTYTAGRADSSTYDGIIPFTTPNDFSTPNETYFARCDTMINLANNHGLVVILDPAETGSFLSVMHSNGATKCRAYGQYLGNRYKNFNNIIWMSGNDFQSWSNASDDSVVTAVALGIKDNDTRHIHTVELNYNISQSLDDPNWAPIISLNAAYTYSPTYAEVLKGYNMANFDPVFMVEAVYEFESNAQSHTSTPLTLRRQEYWTDLSGATGQLYGNHYTWTFTSGWQTHLDTPGAIQMANVKALFEPRAWYNLVPDQNHATLTAGFGTFTSSGEVDASDYATAGRTPDGSLVMAYMPTLRTFTINMAQLSGPVTARWYDPANGSFTAIAGSPFANSGSHAFAPPGNNSEGSPDWVLVLEASAGGPVAPSISQQPANRTVTVGQTASFSVTASGTAPLSYQWQKNGANISGATGSSTTTPATVSGDNGSTFRCVVSNSAGSVTSASATLTVTSGTVGTGTGLTGQYYDNIDFTNLKVTRTDATVNFNWGSGSPDPSIGVDTFSVRWTGQVQAQFSETYTFFTESDDGIRLWVNGVLVINNWTDHAPTENSGTISLSAGVKYDLKLEYYENGGGAVAQLLWSSPSTPKQVVPQSQLYPAAVSGGGGLTGQYFDNIDFTNLKVTRTDATVNFNWGTGSPDPSIGVDTFSVRWTGQVQAQFSETYTFYTESDDGIRLWVNGVLVINNWTDHAPTENSGTISLSAGVKYDLKLEYYENGGGAVAQLLWSSPSTPKQVVPQSQLTPTSPSVEIQIGDTIIEVADDSGNANLLLAQQATLSQTATLESLSFYVTTAAGKLRMGVYDATGPGGGPGAIKAQTAEITPVVGWNTAAVVTQVSLPPGNYWLAYLPSDNNLHFRVERGTGSTAYYGFTYGALPSTFSGSPIDIVGNWSFYATLRVP